MSDPVVIACPCGGHRLTLPADTLPVGGRASFVCPACRTRRFVVGTADGARLDDSPQTPAEPVAPAPPPSPVPPATRLALAVADEAAWREALRQALPPDWHVLAPESAEQALVDCAAHAPALVLLDDSPAARAVAAALAALPGSRRERLVTLALAPAAEADPLAAFAYSADSVLNSRMAKDKAGRIRAALARAADLPSLFTEGRG
ncbi:MAG: hypothetical protein ACLGQH_12530 [Acidobacteriota bacterium]